MGKGCWGEEICGPNHVCTPDFACKGKHFKDKFCRVCYTRGLSVPASRVRILADVFHDDFVNSKSGGVWTHFPAHHAPKCTGDRPITFRLIQQTLKCAGPRLLIFRDDAPHIAALTPLPSDWVTMQGTVRLFIRRGTLSLSPRFPVSANPMDALVQAATVCSCSNADTTAYAATHRRHSSHHSRELANTTAHADLCQGRPIAHRM